MHDKTYETAERARVCPPTPSSSLITATARAEKFSTRDKKERTRESKFLVGLRAGLIAKFLLSYPPLIFCGNRASVYSHVECQAETLIMSTQHFTLRTRREQWRPV